MQAVIGEQLVKQFCIDDKEAAVNAKCDLQNKQESTTVFKQETIFEIVTLC